MPDISMHDTSIRDTSNPESSNPDSSNRRPRSFRRPSRRVLFAAAAVAALATLSACASKSNDAGGSGSSSASTVASSSSVPAGPAVLSVASTSMGDVLVDLGGKTVYILTSDTPTTSACPAACLAAWPPIAAPVPLPASIKGVTAKLGTFTNAAGASQLTINGYPAYEFVKDTAPGMVTGQGKVSFGGTWWALTSTGAWITTAPAAPAASTPAASSPAASLPGGY
jgi:predicted lipoprotein with Yx(FWY)xxD motif